MLIRWRDVRDPSADIHLHESLDLTNVIKDFPQVVHMNPVCVDVQATMVSETCVVKGTISADVTYRCSRCLQEFSDRLEIPFAEQFVKSTKETIEDEDEQIAVVGEEIDLNPSIEQAVVLALPYRPLCKQDCAGLCPVCGVNRNESACSCNLERIDPRLEGLAKFFEQK